MISAEKKSVRKQRKVPDDLVYEMMEGKPVYYHGYRSVLNKSKKIEDIMGSSTLQGVLIIYILSVLLKNLDLSKFWMTTNESGMHLDFKNNLSGDILIFKKDRLKASDINTSYAKVPPNIAIEVDTKADLSIFTFQQYLKLKTTKLHNFGVDKVIWILTASKQVIVALPNADWLLIDWNKDIEIMNGITFNIGDYLKKNEIELEEDL